VNPITDYRPILFFDGECNLCNSSVQFIIKRDKKQQFLFAPLQSSRGKEAIAEVQQQMLKVPDSVILYYNGKYYSRSSAALHIARLLGGIWSLFYAGMILPRFIRDGVYEWIARNRYKWFGKRNECMIPTPELRSRFLQ
jgi:predicted DCC family thiol-disulfide oxidoreductase YuxK